MEEKRPFSDMDLKTEKEIKDHTTKQYDCGHSCRICPYPGAKCREDDATARRIQ